MLRNLSYNNPKIQKEVENSVGKSYGIIERIRLGGVGSPKLEITEASSEIAELLELDNNLKFCSIEILRKGVILRFRSVLETYGLIVPFHEMVIFKGDATRYSLHHGSHKISVKTSLKVQVFFKKLMELKTASLGTRIEEL